MYFVAKDTIENIDLTLMPISSNTDKKNSTQHDQKLDEKLIFQDVIYVFHGTLFALGIHTKNKLSIHIRYS